MQGVNPAAIKKKKKSEAEMISAKEMSFPSIKAKTGELEDKNPTAKVGELEGKNPKAKVGSLAGLKTVESKPMKMPEAEIEIELILQGAKKKPEEKGDSYTEDLGHFTTGRSGKDGTWKESGESRAKYLRKLKQLKK